MKTVLIVLVILFASCSEDEIQYCPRDCTLDHQHTFTKIDFEWRQWHEEENKKG
jgi:hypothetical protein